jgi:hypothetical protein
MPVISLDGLTYSGVALTFKLLHGDKHMAWWAIRQFNLETSLWSHRMIKADVRTEKGDSNVSRRMPVFAWGNEKHVCNFLYITRVKILA